MVDNLLAHGANPELTDARGMTSLMLAMANRHEATGEVLLPPTIAAGALDVQDSDGKSALMWASAKGLGGMVEKLLVHGAKPELTDKMGRTALVLGKDTRTIECMMAAGFPPPSFQGQEDSCLRAFATSGYVPYVEALLKAGADAASPDDNGYTSLILALGNGHEAAAEVLLGPTTAADALNVQDTFEYSKRSALMCASEAGLLGMVEKLLAHGAKPELTDGLCQTSLMLALEKGHESVSEVLIKPTSASGCLDVQDTGKYGCRRTALMWASAKGMPGMVEKLLAHGAKP